MYEWKTLRLITMILFLLSGCSAFEPPDPFPDATCVLPCWSGLTPGVSTEGDLNRVVAELTAQERKQLRDDPFVGKCRVVAWLGRNFFNSFSVRDGHVTNVELVPAFNLALGDVVNKFGPPEKIDSWLAEGADGSLYQIDLFYPNRGLSVSVRPDHVGLVERNTRVYVIRLAATNDSRTLLLNDGCTQIDEQTARQRLQAREELLRPWNGFGTVEVRKTH